MSPSTNVHCFYLNRCLLACTAPECHYDAALLSPHVTCDVSPYGGGTPPCYGEWSSINNCACDDPAYTISDTGNTYWCSGGAWNPDVYNVKCTGPCTVDAGENVISKNSAGDVTETIDSGDFVMYSCPAGYSGTGSAQVGCTDGVWDTHQQFNCLAGCNFPNNTSPTDSAVVEPIVHGAVVSLQCEDGYIPRDIRTSTCSDGSFDPEIICSIEQCADDQCELNEESIDGRLDYASPQRYGNLQPPNYCYGQWSFIDSFTCAGEKWVVRPVVSIIHCTDTGGGYQWTKDIHNFTCHEPCRTLSGLSADVKTVDPHGVETNLLEHEQYVTYECQDTTDTVLGVKTASCYDGRWDNQAIPQCVASCYFPANSHSTRGKEEPLSHGDTVILQCNDGYVPRDTVTTQCQDGTFTPGLTCTDCME
ncbi:putative complement factor H-like [Apostichopus japonicus]|uniref:Putative complement factor H-like n=1 Tax=Stichopus japonicus TaxID=307972 RepID=A0A2G8L369_STIJA|nr:putative complement factor H-like [Apostichopus japonicus]